MAFRYKLVHHPKAAADYRDAVDFFEGVDASLAEIFRDDFKTVLRSIAMGRGASTLYAEGSPIRWVKLRRFSYKVFFEQDDEDVRYVLAVVSGRRHPARIRVILRGRRK